MMNEEDINAKTLDKLSKNIQNGKNILRELLTSERYEEEMGHPKQLRGIVIVGTMESGKSTLARFLNQASNTEVRVLWDDQSRYKLNQEELDFLTQIRHIWEGQTILLVVNAHSFYSATKKYRELANAMIFVSFPPPWELYSDLFMERMFNHYKMKIPVMAHTGLIMWRNWVTNKTEWGWITWPKIKVTAVKWNEYAIPEKQTKTQMMKVPVIKI